MARTGRPHKEVKLSERFAVRVTPETYQALQAAGAADVWRPVINRLARSISSAGAADPNRVGEWVNDLLTTLDGLDAGRAAG